MFVFTSAAYAQRGPVQEFARDDGFDSEPTSKPATGSPSRQFYGRQMVSPQTGPYNEDMGGVLIAADYYEGSKDKETIPVILLHGEKRSRADLDPLAKALNMKGYAIMNVDLRGHGESVKRLVEEFPEDKIRIDMPPIAPPGKEPRDYRGRSIYGPRTVDGPVYQPDRPSIELPPSQPEIKVVDYTYAEFGQRDWDAMIYNDLVRPLDYLVFKNNRGELNIKKLCIIGVDKGASVATVWAASDWQNLGFRPMARMTKVLVLISPKEDSETVDTIKKYKAFRDNVAFMTVVGKLNSQKYEAAKSLKDTYFGKKPETEELGMDSKFPIMAWPTEKQGQDLIAEKSGDLATVLDKFIQDRMEKRKDVKWGRR